MELIPLTISEGENSVISTSNINIVLDYAKYGIRDSGVLFSTVPSMLPKHGSLIVEIWKKPGNLQTFTILDLIKNKVCCCLNFFTYFTVKMFVSMGFKYLLFSSIFEG